MSIHRYITSFFLKFLVFFPCVLGRLFLFVWSFKSFYWLSVLFIGLGETKIERLLAFSSVGHVGFLCIGTLEQRHREREGEKERQQQQYNYYWYILHIRSLSVMM